MLGRALFLVCSLCAICHFLLSSSVFPQLSFPSQLIFILLIRPICIYSSNHTPEFLSFATGYYCGSHPGSCVSSFAVSFFYSYITLLIFHPSLSHGLHFVLLSIESSTNNKHDRYIN
ncbi:hypothetical protein XENOCAPTIV_011051 [Xenoophorus captivus]|uniref:Secreted peptide n=1 Tax=Xenoophorus captivus TaxID=1517983 RepID=A0ABV0R1D9_9TELE